MKANRLLLEKMEMLNKWKAIAIPQSKVENVVNVYKQRLDNVIVNRDSGRSPDKRGEEEKYKYLEKVNSQSKSSPVKDDAVAEITDGVKAITLFPVEEAKAEFVSLPHPLEYYKRKHAEISKLVSDPMTLGLIWLTDLIEDVYDYNYSQEREAQKNSRISKTISRLTQWIHEIVEDDKEVVNERFGEFTIEPFGSSVNGLYMHSQKAHSDLDISINFYYNPAVSKEEVLRTIIPAINTVSRGQFEVILESKVPLIKYTDHVTKEEWDLGVNGTLGVVNSKLIRTYLNIDMRYHKMAYFIKFWTKHWKLVGADNGYLSSYAIQMMIIAFLQKALDQPILPSLQEFDRSKFSDIRYYLPRGSAENVCKANCYFITDYEQLVNDMHEKHGENTMSTAELVYKFFDFYKNQFNAENMISIKHGGFCPKQSMKDTNAFSIVDPFQVEHNPGQSVKSHSMSYRTIMSKFDDLLEAVKSGKLIF